MKSALLSLFLCLAHVVPAAADEWALGGYDPVAYLTDGRATPGRGDIATMWKGRIWHFSSEDHRARFESDPHRFLPGFGGLCPLALAEGRRVNGDPRHFVVIGQRFYLTHSDATERKILAAPQRVLEAARKGMASLR